MLQGAKVKKRRTRGTGGIFCKRGWYYIKYYVNGKPVYEATGTQKEKEAREKLKARLGQLAEGRYVGPAADRVTFEDLMQGLMNDYKANHKKTLSDVEFRVRKHLAPFFAGRRAQQTSSADLRAYIAHRQEQGAKNGTINRELAALKRAFNLALEAEIITRKPRFPTLEENNARQGFFERAEFEAVMVWLPDYLRPPVTFAYQIGWRTRSEVLPLRWNQVDIEEGTVRLEVGTTKNKDGRLIYLPQYIQDILEAQWKEHLAHYPDCPWVFHNQGERIFTFYKAWRTACRKANLSGKIPHDFRRTAIRNMVRAGIPERVAMQIAGHKTRSIFDRYHIVSDGDLREAARKMETAISSRTVTTLVTTPSLTEEELSANNLQAPVIH
jgi:integrase